MKTKLYVQAIKSVSSYSNDEFEISVHAFKRESDQFNVVVDICERIVSFDVPEISQELLVAGEVDQIERAIQTELDRSLKAVTELQERKAKLLSLEFIEA